MSKIPHWLDLSEYLVIATAMVGSITVARSAAPIAYALIPISISLILNAVNRWRSNQSLQLQNRLLERKLFGELAQQNESFHEEIIQARSLATALSKQAIQKTESLALAAGVYPEEVKALEQEVDSQKRLMLSMQEHVAGVEGSLKEVVDLLEDHALPDRIEYLERNFIQLTQQLGLDGEDSTTSSSSDTEDLDIMPLLDMISEDLMSSELYSRDLNSDGLSGDVWKQSSWNLDQTIDAHSDWVRCLSFTPDGARLVSGSFDKTIKVWQLDSGKAIYDPIECPKGVFTIAVSPNGQLLASGSWDETIELWNVSTGKIAQKLVGHTASVRSLVISTDSQTLISGSFDQTIKLWNLPDGKVTRTIINREPITAICLSPDGQFLASTGDNGRIEFWSMKTGELIGESIGNRHCIGSLSISPDSKTIAAGTVNGYIIFWKLEFTQNGQSQQIAISQTIKAHAGQINACLFSPDGQYLITGSVDGKAKVWYRDESLNFGDKTRSILSGDPGRSVMSIAIDYASQKIAIGAADGSIQLWEKL